jgi:hypothetical protein
LRADDLVFMFTPLHETVDEILLKKSRSNTFL